MDIFEKRRRLEEQSHKEALSKLEGIGWSLWWEPRFRKYQEYIGENKNVSILDLGSGITTSLLRLLKQEGYQDLEGFELSKSSSLEARKYGIRVIVGDLEKEDLAKKLQYKKYDFVILAEVIEHLFYSREVLVKIKKLLKSEGKLIISTPNASFWTNGILLTLFPKYLSYFSTAFGTEEHLHFFTFYSLIKILEDSGFEVEEMCGTPCVPRRPIKKQLLIRFISTTESLIYGITNLFVSICPRLFSQFIIIKAGVKNE